MQDQLAQTLESLVNIAGVSGNEYEVADYIRGQLQAYGVVPEQIHNDRLGNLWASFGEGEAARMMAAHMDEIGLRITSIRSDGICRVTAVGGIDPQLWEGTPVVVHTAKGQVPGCIAPVSHHITFRSSLGPKGRISIEDLLVDVGAGSQEEARGMGLSLLDTVTWPKKLVHLGHSLVQGRSLDDRFGCCALLVVAKQLIDSPPTQPVILAWPVQEEVGLRGAKILAQRFNNLDEVIAVDSFTVGTGPRDNQQFAECTLGAGAVLRSLDSTTLVPERQRRSLLDKAQGLGFPLQYGYMPGGNDASVFEASGALVFGLAVPLQYSHSQVERIHLGDLEKLTGLLIAWCSTEPG